MAAAFRWDTHGGGLARAWVSGMYCVLPPFPDGRFVVLSYQSDSPFGGRKQDVWMQFLNDVRRVRK